MPSSLGPFRFFLFIIIIHHHPRFFNIQSRFYPLSFNLIPISFFYITTFSHFNIPPYENILSKFSLPLDCKTTSQIKYTLTENEGQERQIVAIFCKKQINKTNLEMYHK